MDVFTHEEHDRPFITNLITFRIRHPNNIITGHLNINFNKNKFELLFFLIGFKFDILLKSETKIDGSLTTSEFLLSGYFNVYRLDQSDKGGGIMLFF